MTTPPNDQFFESYIPVYDTIPEEWEEARQILVEYLKKISNAINIREIGWFLDEELLSGKQFIPSVNSTQQFRSILRKVIDFGTLPNAGLKQIPHGINIDANFSLIDLWASSTSPGTLESLNIPYVGAVFNDSIQIFLDSTNINIRTFIDYTSYTRTFVVIEYIQEI